VAMPHHMVAGILPNTSGCPEDSKKYINVDTINRIEITIICDPSKGFLCLMIVLISVLVGNKNLELLKISNNLNNRRILKS
jgi:hypothetical protein